MVSPRKLGTNAGSEPNSAFGKEVGAARMRVYLHERVLVPACAYASECVCGAARVWASRRKRNLKRTSMHTFERWRGRGWGEGGGEGAEPEKVAV